MCKECKSPETINLLDVVNRDDNKTEKNQKLEKKKKINPKFYETQKAQKSENVFFSWNFSLYIQKIQKTHSWSK